MIEFRCPHCGKGLRVEDTFAGKKGECVGCGLAVEIPKPVAAKGIRIEDGSLGDSAKTKPSGPPPTPAREAGLFPVAEGSCRFWRAGELPPPGSPEHTVTHVGRAGLRFVLGKKTKGKTLAHVKRQPWAKGELIEVDLKVGAFAGTIRLYAQITRLERRGLDKDTHVHIRITQASEDAMQRLQLLEQRFDLRQRRSKDAFT